MLLLQEMDLVKNKLLWSYVLNNINNSFLISDCSFKDRDFLYSCIG